MDPLRIDQVINRINAAFGEELPFMDSPPDEAEVAVLNRVFGDQGFRAYLQDQVNRQIIRDYLTNAVLLGFLSDQRLAAYAEQCGSLEGRALLSLHMLMSSVEEAESLPWRPLGSSCSRWSPGRTLPPIWNSCAAERHPGAPSGFH